MSILSAASTSQPTLAPQTAGLLVLGLFAWTVTAIALAIRFQVFRPQRVIGPPRVPGAGSLATLIFVLFIALSTWMLSQAAYVGYKQAQWRHMGMKDIPKDISSLLTPGDFAILSTLPPMLGFAVLIGAGLLIGSGWLDGLGISLRKLGPGLLRGIIGFLIVGPIVFWALVALNYVYQKIGFEHPTEHVLLKSLGEARDNAAVILIGLGAAICAPLFEELLFRGHLQTLIRQLLMRLWAVRVPVSSPDPQLQPLPTRSDVTLAEAAAGVPPLLDYTRVDPTTRYALQLAAWHGWLAIFLTSLIFAMFHPLWMWPPIFVLSIGLGYIYERTGNLWAAITIHCLFNSLETVQYMLLMRGH